MIANDLNDCTVITTPCDSIGEGISQAGPNDRVHVDEVAGNYNEAVALVNGVSLLADDFDSLDSGDFTILGAAGAAIQVAAGQTGGTVSGFQLAPAAGQSTVFLEGPVTLRDNTISNVNGGVAAIDLSTPSGGTGTVIDDNTLLGPGSVTENTAIGVNEGTPQVINNTIGTPGNGFTLGVRVTNDSNPTVDGNVFRALFDPGGAEAFAVYVFDAHATITDNAMSEGGGTGNVSGIAVQQNPLSPDTGATIRRNDLRGSSGGTGIGAFETPDPVIIESNLVAGFATGIDSEGFTGPTDNDGDISVTNATVVDNGQDIEVEETHLTLDSSIVEDPISLSGTGNPGCTISFSRGPSTLLGACTQFQTTASPGFVAAGGPVQDNDYHLTATSAMVETGTPAAPAAGIRDIDGGPRSCDGNGDGALRRDIGADELRTPITDDCASPNTSAGKAKVRRARRRAKRRARVSFTSTDPNSTFQCKLDAGAFKACPATMVFRRLKLGRHTFVVRARDAFGNADQTPATGSFRVRRVRRR